MKDSQIKHIKSLMEALRLTKSTLAEKCDVSTMTIHRILTDETYNPTQKTIQALADALEVDEQDIMQGSEETKTRIKINGYIDYQGTITRIETIKQLETLYKLIKSDEAVNRLSNEIKEQEKENKKHQSKVLDIDAIDLLKYDTIDTKQICTHSFRSNSDIVDDKNNDLGNMATRYGFDLFGEHFHNSECAYICGMFSMNTPKCIEIQRELQASANGYNAKKEIRGQYEKRAKECVRTDWNTFNVEWMKFVVWQKCKGNEEFRKMLLAITQNAIIVENSTFHKKPKEGEDKPAFWGARNYELEKKRAILERSIILSNPKLTKKELEEKVNKVRNSIHTFGVWEGTNCMGKILTLCKYHLHHKTELPINYDLLRSKQIYLFGKLLTFQKTPQTTVIFDFDGTLVDTRPLDQYQHLFKGKERLSDEWRKGMGEYLSHVKDCPVYEGINDVIEFLRQSNINVCVVTAGIKEKVKVAAQIFGWKDIIKAKYVFGRHSFGLHQKVTKSDANPMLFEKALEAMQVEATNCIAFGNEINDTIAAQKLGIRAYNCAWGATDNDLQVMKETMPDITIYSPKQIIDILKR